MDKSLQILRTKLENLTQHTEEQVEFWFARDLQLHLGYQRWENFKLVS